LPLANKQKCGAILCGRKGFKYDAPLCHFGGGRDSTHGERLLILFQVILELVFDKSPIISVVGADIAAKCFGLACKSMLGSQGLFSIGGQLKIDVAIVCGTIYKNHSAGAVVRAKVTFGLRDQTGLTTFQLVNVDSTP
jgi:hypothetical protein